MAGFGRLPQSQQWVDCCTPLTEILAMLMPLPIDRPSPVDLDNILVLPAHIHVNVRGHIGWQRI